MSDSLQPCGLHHTRLPCPSLSPRDCSNSCPLSLWCHLILCHPLLLCPSIFPSFRIFSNELALRIRWQSIGTSASVLPMNIQGWFPLGLTGLISLLSNRLSRVFSSTTLLLLLLLSRFSRVRLCATPLTAAYQAPPSLGFSRQEHWSGLPFPSPMHESEKWKWSCSVGSDS